MAGMPIVNPGVPRSRPYPNCQPMRGSPNADPSEPRAELLAKTGAYDEARRAYEIATGLERDPAVRTSLAPAPGGLGGVARSIGFPCYAISLGPAFRHGYSSSAAP